jgi:oligoribonuclease NrnB/cAMP/cGMP phosphodiesterase (DHH superfamily)
MKIKLFTHDDLDGVGCFILLKCFCQDVDVEYCSYGDINEKLDKWLDIAECADYSALFITDISVNAEIAEKLNKLDNENLIALYLLDHHQTADWLQKKYPWAQVDSSPYTPRASGTSMVWNYLVASMDKGIVLRNSLKGDFAEYVRLYDTWEHNEHKNGEMSRNLNTLLGIYGKDLFVKKMLEKFHSNILSLDEQDMLLIENEKHIIKEYVDKTCTKPILSKILGYEACIVFAEEHVASIGEELKKRYPDVEVIAIIDMNKQKISYRTPQKDFNTGLWVAKPLGGGGHPAASGSQINDSQLEETIRILFFYPCPLGTNKE